MVTEQGQRSARHPQRLSPFRTDAFRAIATGRPGLGNRRPRQPHRGAAQGPRAPVQGGAEPRRIQLEPAQLPGPPRPSELVLFVTVQEVVLARALLDRRTDRQPRREQSDAVPAVLRIKSRLVEVKGLAVAEAVQRGRRPPIEREDEEPEPAALAREL